MITSVTNSNRMIWGLKEISVNTGLSVNFLRYEIRRGNLKTRKFGRRVMVRHEDLREYIDSGSEGSRALGLEG